MSTLPAVRESAEIARSSNGDVASQLMAVIAANPTAGADNLKALLDGMERVTKWQAERDFIAAFSRLKFPPIVKSKKGQNAKYAPYEDIQEIIEPILAAEGFTLSFSSGAANDKGEIPTFGKLSHIGGHSEPGVIYLPRDGVDTKSGGRNMNALQGVASSTSYGMRYCAKLMLNLRFIGEDDDGHRAGTIDPNKQRLLREAIMSVGADESKLLALYGVKAISDLPAPNFDGAVTQLNAKYRQKLLAEGCDEDDIQAKINKLWGWK